VSHLWPSTRRLRSSLLSPASRRRTRGFAVELARGGPSGCALAAGLANSTAKPRVLLLEAGDNKEDRNPVELARPAARAQPDGPPARCVRDRGPAKSRPNEDHSLRVDGQRWLTFQDQSMNWGFKTTPQTDCNNREIDYLPCCRLLQGGGRGVLRSNWQGQRRGRSQTAHLRDASHQVVPRAMSTFDFIIVGSE
jgi:hypothetical protein